MKKVPTLPYLYDKFLRAFNYSVIKWKTLEGGLCHINKRTTHSDLIITREYDKEKKQFNTWASTQQFMVKLEIFTHTEGSTIPSSELHLVMKYGYQSSTTPEQMSCVLPAGSSDKKIKREIHRMIYTLYEKNFIC